MAALDLSSLARAAGAEILGERFPKRVPTVETDTRSLSSGALFVALRGPRFDGHRFIDEAARQGAVAAVVARNSVPTESVLPLLVVDDTLVALGAMARSVRQDHLSPVVGITGSNGKTTAKELTAQALSVRGPVHRTSGNLNNRIGVPRTIFDWPDDAWAAVIEMGMNEAGEIATLTSIAAPDVGMITVVGPAHLEKLSSVERVARAKGELFAGLGADAVAVVNIDDPWVVDVARPLLGGQSQITFGYSPDADVRVSRVDNQNGGLNIAVELRDHGPCEFYLPLIGRHNAMNAAAALACAMALGVPIEGAAQALGRTRLPGSRLRVLQSKTPRVTILDDSYNANPQSAKAALGSLAELAGDARRVVVFGDMLELGDHGPALHRELGATTVASGVRWILALGELSRNLIDEARRGGGHAEHFESMDALLAALTAGLKDDDCLLLKGSRAMCLERVLEHFDVRSPSNVGGR